MLKRNDENAIVVNNSMSQPNPALRLDWLGQMVASTLWAASVIAYGVNSTGDVLQLSAALAWMVANVAAFMRSRS